MTLVATVADPIPDGALCERFEAPDGTGLRLARFMPTGPCRGTVVILNGRGEFIEKYFEVISGLLAQGFAVASMDWRGQGLSERPLPNRHKGHVAHFSLFVDDLQAVIESFVLPACPKPLVVLSHSMGGNIVLQHLAQHPGVFKAAFFSAPMWGLGKSERPGAGAKLLANSMNGVGLSTHYVPGRGDFNLKENNFEGNVLTSDPERFERFMAQIAAEPQLALGAPTVGWIKQALDAVEVLHAPGFAEAIKTPSVVCSAGRDALVSNASHLAICKRLPHARSLLIEGSRHELLVEVDAHRDRTLAAFDELMDELGI